MRVLLLVGALVILASAVSAQTAVDEVRNALNPAGSGGNPPLRRLSTRVRQPRTTTAGTGRGRPLGSTNPRPRRPKPSPRPRRTRKPQPAPNGGPTAPTTLPGELAWTKSNYPALEAVPSKFTLNLDAMASVFGKRPENLDAALSTKVTFPTPAGPLSAVIPSHVTPNKKIIMYNDNDGVFQSDISRFIDDGEIGITVKHHTPKNQEVTFGAPGVDMKEFLKEWTTHIGLFVGVQKDGKRGAITVNNPQGYQGGRFGGGSADYPVVLLRFRFADDIKAEARKAYINNIRTWAVMVNAFASFPSGYNGGDPMRTTSLANVQEYGNYVVQAIIGDATTQSNAKAWLSKPENQLYCAEMASVILNLGIHVPLNDKGLTAPIAAQVATALKTDTWFQQNPNRDVGLIARTMAPPELEPMYKALGLTPEPDSEDGFDRVLAIKPFNTFDALERFIQLYVPREKFGGKVQALAADAVMNSMLKEKMSPAQVEALKPTTTALSQTLAADYPDYKSFKAAVSAHTGVLRQVFNPRGKAENAFIPPHCWWERAHTWEYKKIGQGQEPASYPDTDSIVKLDVVGYAFDLRVLSPSA